MPVSVTVPVRLRVDPEALERRGDLIDEAIEAAVGRALAASRDAVLPDRGGYLQPRAGRPTIRWSGSGLSRTTAPVRRAVEERLERALAKATAESGLFDGRTADIPIPLGDEAAESIDESRHAPFLGSYVLPSFGEEGEETWVELESRGRGAFSLQDWIPHTEIGKRGGLRFLGDFLWSLADAYPDATVLGFILKIPGGFFIQVVRRDGDEFSDLFWLKPMGLRGTGIDPATGEVKEAPDQFEATATFRLQWLASAGSGSDERKQISADFVRETLEYQIKRDAAVLQRRLGPDAWAELPDKVEKAVAEAGELGGGPVVWNLFINERRNIIASNDFPQLTDEVKAASIPLVPIAEARPSGGKGKGGGAGSAGDGAKGKAGTGTGTAGAKGGGAGDRGEGPPGEGQPGFVAGGQNVAETGGRAFPSGSGDTIVLSCDALNDEPSLDQLGPDGEVLRGLMEEIAYRLQMPTCEHAGRFCLNAGMVLGGRAHAVGQMAAEDPGSTKPVSGGGNLGGIQFQPVPSQTIQLLRHLAGVVPLISGLQRTIDDTYAKAEHRGKLGGYYTNDPMGWRLRLTIELSDAMKESVSVIFGMANRSLFLQLLRSSREAIRARITHFEQYAPLFERLVAAQLMEVDELNRLRQQLVDALPSGVLQDVGSFAVDTWKSAHRATSDILGGKDPFRPSSAPPGKIVKAGDTVVGISDTDGRVWTKDELDQAIATRQQTAEGIDPLVKQIRDLPDLMDRLRLNRTTIRAELWKLLAEMLEKNGDTIESAQDSWMFAVRASTIVEASPGGGGAPPAGPTVRNSSYHLQHLHLMTHEAIGDAFMNDPYYGLGIDWLFDVEQGKAALREFFEFTGLVILAVLCAPLAVAVGAAVAGYHLYEARQRESIYMSLIDPDLVLSAAEVEAGLFAAELGALLAFLPAGKQLASGATVVTKAIVRRGVSRGTQVAIRYYRQRLTQQLVQQLQKELVPALVKEFAEEQLEDVLFDKLLMGPAIEQLQNELLVGAQAPAGAVP